MASKIDQICRRSGLAKSTVYAALSSGGRISDATRFRVMKIARDLGYRPNSAAKAIASGRFNAIAYLLSGLHRSRFSVGLTSGVHDGAQKHGKHIMLSRGDVGVLRQYSSVPRVLEESMCDGLLVDFASNPPAEIIEAIFRSRLPTVWLNTKLQADCVYPNEFAAGRLLAEIAFKAGHRRIAYSHSNWTTPEDESTAWHFSVTDRRDGVRSWLNQSGISVLPGARMVASEAREPHYEDWILAARLRLQTGERPTAVIAYHSVEALAWATAAELMGLRVPQDLTILAFSDEPAYHLGRRISCAVLPEYEIGEKGVDLLMQKIARPGEMLAAVGIDARIEPGDTVAPPPATLKS